MADHRVVTVFGYGYSADETEVKLCEPGSSTPSRPMATATSPDQDEALRPVYIAGSGPTRNALHRRAARFFDVPNPLARFAVVRPYLPLPTRCSKASCLSQKVIGGKLLESYRRGRDRTSRRLPVAKSAREGLFRGRG